MRSGHRFLVRQDVEKQADRSEVERDEDEAPFHHRRFGIVPELVPGNVQSAETGQDEPGEEKVIDWLDEHGFLHIAKSRDGADATSFQRWKVKRFQAYFMRSAFAGSTLTGWRCHASSSTQTGRFRLAIPGSQKAGGRYRQSRQGPDGI
ncbi:hypothetical protein [Neorhizobium galegae]|uniref:hypothetical protein n=1 Tax=Neorhizobium galegae TaxID=399 RepID=UPI002107DD3D|nr:hypothetical protein [Neorhizobium galegae]MCQ1852419.1 hypothetical protein [Neorhizobium galegae]